MIVITLSDIVDIIIFTTVVVPLVLLACIPPKKDKDKDKDGDNDGKD